MKSAVKISVIRVLLPALLLAAPACRRDDRPENPNTPPPTPAAVAPPSAAPDAVVAVDGMTGEEIFRRAFWRRPAAGDRILQAVRHEQRASIGDPATVQTWRWFIQLHPGPELLAALRAPDTFGLLRLPLDAAPRPWSAASDTPDWFPAAATPPGPATATTGFEILQAPSSGLTVLYRASDNMLYATDHGSGFAPPAR